MNAQQFLGLRPQAGEFMIVIGGVILLVGIVFVHFWREIIVGVLAIVLFAHFFKDNGDLINHNTTGLDTNESILSLL